MAKIALAQFDSVLKNVGANVEKMVTMIESAASNNADIIVFPELFTTGYNLDLIEDEILKMGNWLDNIETEKSGDNIKIKIAVTPQEVLPEQHCQLFLL